MGRSRGSRKQRKVRKNKRAQHQQRANATQEPSNPTALAAQGDTQDEAKQPDTCNARPTQQESLKPRSILFRWRAWRVIFVGVELIFAGAIAYFAYVQSDVSEGQLDAMIAQNAELVAQNRMLQEQTVNLSTQTKEMTAQSKAMVEQTALIKGQLEQAQIAISQTQSLINETREARRPWLNLGSVTIEKLNQGEQLVCRVVIENSGQSYGIIRSLNVNLAVVLHGATNKEFFDGIPKETSNDMGITVPADGSWWYLGFGPKVTKTMIKGLANNSHAIRFGGSLNWEDREGNKTTTGMFARSAPFAAKEGKQLTIENHGYYVNKQ